MGKREAIRQYIAELDHVYRGPTKTEHSYREYLSSYVKSVLRDFDVTNEPGKIERGVVPDYAIRSNNIPLGYIEAKDLIKDLDDPEFDDQFTRYKKALGNLIFTNYLEFRLVREGKQIKAVTIGKVSKGRIKDTQQYDELAELFMAFKQYQGQSVTSANNLARLMAEKARLLSSTIGKVLNNDTGELAGQYSAFKDQLIRDLEPDKFADIYAQTVAYGMFAARLHDPTPENFDRFEAARLIPASNPFLRKFFQHIAGNDMDEGIRWMVDDLADLFRSADVDKLMSDYRKATRHDDPFLHFYETFLGEYDPKDREKRGVYYTPQPVVNFIVRAADDLLKSKFYLPRGLADDTKIDGGIHKVQILDPAAGTGTFLSHIVQRIYESEYANQKGIWPAYVQDDLIPRLNGFEIQMSPYAMAHIKLEMVLRDYGAYVGNERLRVFLTDSLEDQAQPSGTPFAQWLATEATEAYAVKKELPVMLVIGNPPYSSISMNRGQWITKLIEEYKYIDGIHFKERKHWLDDDYVKFIRYGQYHIDKSGEGILAFINNHSYLDNPTFRGMRWNLLQSFDEIYILDLHGNALKKETTPDGSPDQNVFDIQQGVSINLFVKTRHQQQRKHARVLHADLYGTRETKEIRLNECSLSSSEFTEIQPQAPQYYFVPKVTAGAEEYGNGFVVNDLFPEKVTGVITSRDGLVIDMDQDTLIKRIYDFVDPDTDDEEIRDRYFGNKKSRSNYPPGDSRGWKLGQAREKIRALCHEDIVTQISYRPFDNRYIYYHPDMVDWGREKLMSHFLKSDGNTGLMFTRQVKAFDTYQHIFITRSIFDSTLVSNKTSEIGYGCPLYLYPESQQQDIDVERQPNVDPAIVQQIAERLGIPFTPEKQDDTDSFAPIDLLDYIYAVLHSPAYRARYKAFLKTDFPRVPYPTNTGVFWQLVKLGGELRASHLLEHPACNDLITGYNVAGNNQVDRPKYDGANVYINATQCFENVPVSAWEFYIGGYQPAQKWLKDRRGRTLTPTDINHYQRMIVALDKTGQVMAEIDNNQ